MDWRNEKIIRLSLKETNVSLHQIVQKKYHFCVIYQKVFTSPNELLDLTAKKTRAKKSFLPSASSEGVAGNFICTQDQSPRAMSESLWDYFEFPLRFFPFAKFKQNRGKISSSPISKQC